MAARDADGGLIRAAALVALLAVVGPILLTPTPPLFDYPNHLARFWLLAGGDHVAPVSGMYRVDWRQASTNIGIDLLVAAITKTFSYQVAGKCILVLTIAGPPAGAMLLNRVAFGRWHWWQIGLTLLAWTTTALFGFLSYQAALAVALFLACLEPVFQRHRIAGLLARVVCGWVVLLFHPFGLLFYGLLVAALVVGSRWPGWRSLAWAVATAALTVLVPVALLFATARTPPGDYAHRSSHLIYWGLHLKGEVLTLASPFLSYKAWADALFFLFPLGACAVAAATGRLRGHAGLLIAAGLTAAVSLATPFAIGDASWINRRFPLMAALALFAGVQPELLANTVWRPALAAVMLLVSLGRSTWIGAIWTAREHDVRAVEQALSHVPAGAALFVVQSEPHAVSEAPVGRYLAGIPGIVSETALRHIPALAVPERHAFVPTLFAVPGQQPLRFLPPWDRLAAIANVPDAHVLDGAPSAEDLQANPGLADWARTFDYVVMIGADQADAAGPFAPPPQLALVSDDRYARLYRVLHKTENSGPRGSPAG